MDDGKERKSMITEKDMFEVKAILTDWRSGFIETEMFVEAIGIQLGTVMERNTGSRELPEGMRKELDRMELAAHGASAWYEMTMDRLRDIVQMFDREKEDGSA